MAISIPAIRQDSRGVPNGYKVDKATLVGLAKDTWLQPNVTFTLHTFSQAGQVTIPKSIRGGINPTKNLCDVITTSTNNTFDFMTLAIDTYVYATIGSCFDGANLVNYETLSMLDKAELDKIREAWIHNLLSKLVSKATLSTTVLSQADLVGQIKDMIADYQKVNHRKPDVVVINTDVYKLIEAELIGFGGLDTVQYALNGFAGSIKQVPVVVDDDISDETIVGKDKAVDILVTSKEALHVAIAVSRGAVVINQRPISSASGFYYSNSLVFRETGVRGLEILTDVMLPFGMAVDETQAYAYVFVLPTP